VRTFQKIRVTICLKVWPLLEFPQQHGRLAFQKLEALARSEDLEAVKHPVWDSDRNDLEGDSSDSWETESEFDEEEEDGGEGGEESE